MYDEYMEIKNHKNDCIVMIKVGNFYHIYDKDSIIISYLLGYKVNDDGRVGFPIKSLCKVTNYLKKQEINYYINDDDFREFDNNYYYQILEKSELYYALNKDIEDIYNYLIDNIDRKYIKRIINKIKEVIDEG